MARAIGLPSRVGVGFTTGELGPDGFYSVRGYHGHAWPEVYLAGFGWVPFEPTPGRGIPGGEAYTGVPEAQAAPGSPNTATTLATTTTVTTPGQAGSTTTVPRRDLRDNGSSSTATKISPWLRRLAIAVALLVLLPSAWIGAIALARSIRRRRRRARAANAADRVVVAWQEIGDALTLVGVPARPSETPTEYATRAARLAGVDPEVLGGLAGLTTASRYAPDDELDIDDDTLERALADAAAIEHALTQHLDRSTRLRNAVDPRVPAGR
jgi:hypothetical protein